MRLKKIIISFRFYFFSKNGIYSYGMRIAVELIVFFMGFPKNYSHIQSVGKHVLCEGCVINQWLFEAQFLIVCKYSIYIHIYINGSICINSSCFIFIIKRFAMVTYIRIYSVLTLDFLKNYNDVLIELSPYQVSMRKKPTSWLEQFYNCDDFKWHFTNC